MSEDRPAPRSSRPTSSGGLLLRVLMAAIVIAGIGGVIWYMNK